MTTDQSYPAIDRVLTILRERLHVHVTAANDYTNKHQGNNEDLLTDDDNRVIGNRDDDYTIRRIAAARDSDESSFFDIKLNENNSNINEFLYHERYIDDHDDVDIDSKLSKSTINVDHSNDIVGVSKCIKAIPSKLALIAMRLASMQDLSYRDDNVRCSRRKYTSERKTYILEHLLMLQRSFDGILGYNQYYRKLQRKYQCCLRRLWDEQTVANRFNRLMKSNCIRRLGKERLAALYDRFR
jgi:hypothetical protein